jgi:mRNA-degrading endonuclease RelE of RelBE toxin-antitoxin system
MKYSVIWLPAAEQELARIWLNATDRNAVSNASNLIDRRLQTNPENVGESRSNDQRITFEEPLAVLFQVVPDDVRVWVIHVWSSQSE